MNWSRDQVIISKFIKFWKILARAKASIFIENTTFHRVLTQPRYCRISYITPSIDLPNEVHHEHLFMPTAPRMYLAPAPFTDELCELQRPRSCERLLFLNTHWNSHFCLLTEIATKYFMKNCWKFLAGLSFSWSNRDCRVIKEKQHTCTIMPVVYQGSKSLRHWAVKVNLLLTTVTIPATMNEGGTTMVCDRNSWPRIRPAPRTSFVNLHVFQILDWNGSRAQSCWS